jgi:hypothetical protein
MLSHLWSEPATPKRAAHYLWAVLLARIDEVFQLLCLLYGGEMRIIALIWLVGV